MAFSFALALVITRHRRDVSMAPATCLSQLLIQKVYAGTVILSGRIFCGDRDEILQHRGHLILPSPQ